MVVSICSRANGDPAEVLDETIDGAWCGRSIVGGDDYPPRSCCCREILPPEQV